MSEPAQVWCAKNVVFIGGVMTLADGRVVDSRQPGTDDATTRAVQQALTSTPEWWLAASSIVLPTLGERDDARFALVIGSRSVVRRTADGELKRSMLKKRLQGGVDQLLVRRSGIGERLPPSFEDRAILRNWSDAHMGTVGFFLPPSKARWRFLDGNEFYLGAIAHGLPASVVVDTVGEAAPAFLDSRLDAGTLKLERLPSHSAVSVEALVLPDTPRMREMARRAMEGEAALTPLGHYPPSDDYDPTAPKAPEGYLRMGTIGARCSVTGLLRSGEWSDGSDLEAARVLLLQRFDLRIGLWDLASNPVLRATVLEPTPTGTPPTGSVHPAEDDRQRAARAVVKARERANSADRGAREVFLSLHEVLEPLGWEYGNARLSLPLTEPLSNWPGNPPHPLATLDFELTKSSCRVVARQWFYNRLDLRDFVRQRREEFCAVEDLPSAETDSAASVRIWQRSIGWGTRDTDWKRTADDVARKSAEWRRLLEDLVAACRDILRQRSLFRG